MTGGFCYFCDGDARKLKNKIAKLEAEVERMVVTNEYLMQLQRIKNIKKQTTPTFNQVFGATPQRKKKLIKIVKEALLLRNMTEGEADNLIHILINKT